MHRLPEVGQLAVVRKRPFVVTEIVPSAPGLGSIGSEPNHLIKLSSVEDDGLGEELQIIWELEPGTSVYEKSNLPDPDSFDHPKRLQAFLDAVRWGAVSQADDKALQSPFRSGIEIDEYQLDPVVRALSMPRVNLLIADDVGLGKTVEAGLVIQEMILRHRVRSVLIACPSSLQMQWKEEMRDKFGLEFRIVDSESVSQLRRKRGIHVNPWNHFPRLITSVDYLKRERQLRSFRETLPSGDQPTFPRAYDLMIVDEAHNVAPSGRGKYATDSMRTLAIRSLVPHFEHKLFLSATPHNGYRESFAALLELLDNQRFARAVTPNRAQLDAVMVRRMKSELKLRWDGSRRFAERMVKHLEVPYTDEEREAHRALREYSELRLKQATSDGERMAAEFVLKLLKKRLFSSPAAFGLTLEKHIGTVGRSKASKATTRDIEDYSDDFADDEAYEAETSELVSAVSQGLSPTSAAEKALLRRLSEFAAKASQRPDCKAQALIDWLKATLRPGGKWNDERVIIFTEYRATQKWLFDLLAREEFAQDGRLEMIYGGMPNEHREPIKAAFQTHPKDSAVRILLATDAASEGVNLQNYCSKLIHFEIPWNPNRMEQRNGRVDRHGQKANEVHIHHFVGRGFDRASTTGKVGELEGDLEFLMRAALKVETIREDLGKVGPVIALQVEEAMLGKRSRLDTNRAEQDAEPVRRMLKFDRKLREQLERLASQLNDTKHELNLTPEHIENVVRVGLDLAGQPGLIPVEVDGIWPDPAGIRKTCPVFRLPALTNSWAQCADGLAHPHSKMLRPIVFDAALATGRDGVVLAHLNHRLVQMCLRLLRAEIWSLGSQSKHLSRVSACVVDDSALSHPVVIAHGRIVVLGGDNHRLHEEVITAGGALVEGRFNRLNVSETKAALAAITDIPAPASIEARFQDLWPKQRDALLSALEARRVERTKNLEKNLDELAEKEVNKIAAVMTELKRSIQLELTDKDNPQLLLDLGGDEPGRHQRERDLDALRRRFNEIPDEIARESEHIRSRFANPSARLFPVAVTWLIPRRAVHAVTGGKA
ncbi:DISARM system SNF2-like helicase DrmD [Hydrogenophaga sp. PBL-H3]|uniref:DISARM system SNF2-like helicase DrmD n=1 Tax=Hydrogenophaga sp. PBL-H3 TaxID=434010 RepID=UPI00131F752D|nr:DISARM system SNF2-like helicase DrmD [Hydrogenophaga sp. PBL-H3]QHE76131.1 DEAD/DEAH box helicase [Hydrogenophaga sp. PBL-H3]QHE80555.1 DEAD/DEAH box helicase [Hydrogenophaga sp. PBL-H3]